MRKWLIEGSINRITLYVAMILFFFLGYFANHWWVVVCIPIGAVLTYLIDKRYE